MTTQVRELQTSVPRHLKNRIVQTCGKLFDEARLSRTRGTVEIQRIKFVHEPDGGIPCRFVKAVMRVDGRCIQARILVAPYGIASRHSAEDKSGIHFRWREGFQFLNGL